MSTGPRLRPCQSIRTRRRRPGPGPHRRTLCLASVLCPCCPVIGRPDRKRRCHSSHPSLSVSTEHSRAPEGGDAAGLCRTRSGTRRCAGGTAAKGKCGAVEVEGSARGDGTVHGRGRQRGARRGRGRRLAHTRSRNGVVGPRSSIAATAQRSWLTNTSTNKIKEKS